MAAELIDLLRPHVRFNVTGPVRSDWRETAPAHVDVVEALATWHGMEGVAGLVYEAVESIGVSRGFVPLLCAGIDFGGALIATAAAVGGDGDFPARYVRHESCAIVDDGDMRTLHYWSVIGDVAGKRVVVLDDVATTGRSLMSAVSALREAGAIVEDAIVVVDREEGAAALLAGAGVRLRALVTLKDLA